MEIILRIVSEKIFSKRLLENIVIAMLIIGTILTVIPNDLALAKFTSNYAVQIMLSYLLLGIIFLIFRQQRLLLASFLCSAALCLFLKSYSNGAIMLPKQTSEIALKVAYLNTADADADYEQLMESILDSDADLITIQEVTPDWSSILESSLAEKYPYQKIITRIDFYGQAVFSKFPFQEIDTFHYNDIPNIKGSIQLPDSRKIVTFVASHTTPSFKSTSFYKDLRDHLNTIVEQLQDVEGPKIALGAFNTVEWSTELQDFRNILRLNSSRRDTNPFGQIPYEHIFYSSNLECVGFSSILSSEGSQVGIKGTYQLTDFN